MLLLNFSHPITKAQHQQLETMLDQALERIVDVPAHFDNAQPFAEQTIALIERAGQLADLDAAAWQSVPLLINPPALNHITAVLLAEIHGRAGYFPPVLRIRPVPGSVPPRFEVAEVIDLDQVRRSARQNR